MNNNHHLSFIIIFNYIVSVSYTHLDVYKRQIVLFDNAPMHAREGAVTSSTSPPHTRTLTGFL